MKKIRRKYNLLLRMIFIVSMISLGLVLRTSGTETTPINLNSLDLSIATETQYVDHGIINIQTNSEFLSMAENEGWEGDGTADNPIIIQGYRITDPKNPLIFLSRVDLFFTIEKCYLYKGDTGIEMIDCRNGHIADNKIEGNDHGIHMIRSTNTVISGNEIYNNTDYSGCIYLSKSNNNTISGNNIHHNIGAVRLLMSEDNNIVDNVINNTKNIVHCSGLIIEGSIGTEVIDNEFVGNMGMGGIYIPHKNVTNDKVTTTDTLIEGNTIYHNDAGIWAEGTEELQIINNNIYDTGLGVLIGASNKCYILNNTIYNNEWWAVDLRYTAFTNISWNNFLGNHYYVLEIEKYVQDTVVLKEPSYSQAREFASSSKYIGNDFVNNYWGEDETKDADKDGIIDTPYLIAGTSNNSDIKPLAHPLRLNIPLVTTPRINYPMGFEAIKGSTSISWSESIVYPETEIVTYSIYYGEEKSSYDPKLVESWNLVVSGLTATEYSWDISLINDGWYHIKVVAETSSGLKAEDTNDFAFSIGIDRAQDQLRGAFGGSIPGMGVFVSVLTMIAILVYRKSRR